MRWGRVCQPTTQGSTRLSSPANSNSFQPKGDPTRRTCSKACMVVQGTQEEEDLEEGSVSRRDDGKLFDKDGSVASYRSGRFSKLQRSLPLVIFDAWFKRQANTHSRMFFSKGMISPSCFAKRIAIIQISWFFFAGFI